MFVILDADTYVDKMLFEFIRVDAALDDQVACGAVNLSVRPNLFNFNPMDESNMVK